MSSDDLKTQKLYVEVPVPVPAARSQILTNHHGCRTIIWTVQHHLLCPLSATSHNQQLAIAMYFYARGCIATCPPVPTPPAHSNATSCERLHHMLHRVAFCIPSNYSHRSSYQKCLHFIHVVLFRNITAIQYSDDFEQHHYCGKDNEMQGTIHHYGTNKRVFTVR